MQQLRAGACPTAFASEGPGAQGGQGAQGGPAPAAPVSVSERLGKMAMAGENDGFFHGFFMVILSNHTWGLMLLLDF